jgi:hypothetical protein
MRAYASVMRPAIWMKPQNCNLFSTWAALDLNLSAMAINRRGRSNARQLALVAKAPKENISRRVGPTQMGSEIKFCSDLGLRRAAKAARQDAYRVQQVSEDLSCQSMPPEGPRRASGLLPS